MKNFKITTNAQNMETTENEIVEMFKNTIESENAESAVAEYAQWFFDNSIDYDNIEIDNNTNSVIFDNIKYSFTATEIN